jgi:general secretion pathway protein M
MMLQLTAQQSRFVAIGLLVLIVLLVSTLVGFPVWKLHQRYDASIDDVSDKLLRYRRIAALRQEIDRSIQDVTELNAKQYYLKGSTRTLAEAELQSLVTRLAESHGCRIISSQVLPAKDDPKTPDQGKVQLSIQLQAAIVPLQVLLHAMEVHQPYLFFDNLAIRASHGRTYKPTPGVQPEYHVQITVAGYMHQSGESK